MLKRPHWVGLGVAIALALVLLNLSGDTTSRLKFALSGLYLPLFGLAKSADKLGEEGGMRLIPKGALIEQVEKLRRENEQLRLDALQNQEIARENAVLRESIGWPKRKDWKLRL